MGSIEVSSTLAQVLLRLAHLILEPLRKLLVRLILARSLLKLALEPADLALKTHLDVRLFGGRLQVESVDLLIG